MLTLKSFGRKLAVNRAQRDLIYSPVFYKKKKNSPEQDGLVLRKISWHGAPRGTLVLGGRRNTRAHDKLPHSADTGDREGLCGPGERTPMSTAKRPKATARLPPASVRDEDEVGTPFKYLGTVPYCHCSEIPRAPFLRLLPIKLTRLLPSPEH